MPLKQAIYVFHFYLKKVRTDKSTFVLLSSEILLSTCYISNIIV